MEESAKVFGGDATIDFPQAADLYPVGFPHFVRGRDSLRGHITKLVSSRVSYYGGAIGTTIQKLTHEEEDFHGARFVDGPAFKG